MTKKELVKYIREMAGIKDYFLDGYYGKLLPDAIAMEIERIFNALVTGEMEDFPRTLYNIIEEIAFEKMRMEK